MFVEWKNSYSVGIPEMDTEHKRLVSMINVLHTAFMAGPSRHDIDLILRELVDYMATHFAHEEDFLRKVNYPRYIEHRRLHQLLTKEVASKYRRVPGDQIPSALELISFLKNWLIGHIMAKDKEYGSFVAGKIYDSMPTRHQE